MENLKLPPQDIEAEHSVLGSLMIDKHSIIKVADLIVSEDFYAPANAKIFEAISDLFQKNEPVDVLSVSAKLKEKKTIG